MEYRHVDDFIRALNLAPEESKMNKNLIKKCKQTEKKIKKVFYEITKKDKMFIQYSQELSEDLHSLYQVTNGSRNVIENAIKRSKDPLYVKSKNKETFH